MRKWFVAATAAAVIAGAAVPAGAAIPARVLVGDQELVSEAAPFIENGRTLVPLTPLAEAFGFEVNVSEDGQKAELVRWPKRVTLTAGSTTAVANGQEIQLDVPAQNVDGTLYVPVRFVAQALGGQVSWDQENWTATVQPPAPEVALAWDLLAKSNELVDVALKGVGTMVSETAMPEVEEPLNVKVNVEVLSEGTNALATVTIDGQDFTAQSALFNGQLWLNMPGEGWTQVKLEELAGALGEVANLAFDLDTLKQMGEDMLAAADVAVTGEEIINGVQTYKVAADLTKVSLMNAVIDMLGEAPFEGLGMSVDKYLITSWIDADGFTHKTTLDMALSMTIAEEGMDPVTIVSKMLGEFVFEPLTEAITWPEAILTPAAPAQPAEEQPAEEQPAEEQPAEEQPAEEQPAEEQPAEEQPAEEQPAEEQPAEEQPAEEQPAEEQPAEEQPTEEQPAEEQPAEA